MLYNKLRVSAYYCIAQQLPEKKKNNNNLGFFFPEYKLKRSNIIVFLFALLLISVLGEKWKQHYNTFPRCWKKIILSQANFFGYSFLNIIPVIFAL